MKSALKTALVSGLTFGLIALAAFAEAQDPLPKAPAEKPKAPKIAEDPGAAAPALSNRAKPYGGNVSAVDASAKTITLKKKKAEKTFMVTASTRINKNGKPATLEDAVIGDEAGISYNDVGGKAVANSLRLGAKPAKLKAVPETPIEVPGKNLTADRVP